MGPGSADQAEFPAGCGQLDPVLGQARLETVSLGHPHLDGLPRSMRDDEGRADYLPTDAKAT